MRKRTTTTAAVGAAAVLVLVGAGCSDEGNVFSLEEGTCFQQPGNTFEVSEVETVDCDEPHFAEVFHTEEVPGDDFPGAEAITQRATEVCQGDAFEEFTGVAFENDAAFGVFPLSPSEGSWDEGHREIFCSVVSLEGGQLTGSAEGEGVPFGEAEGGQAPPAGGGEVPQAGEPDQPPDIDDPTHAQLAEDCFEGSGQACDDLFFQTPSGSPEEEYGNTCGGRFDTSPGFCAEAIGG